MSSYGRVAPPSHNYELFSIIKLVGINNQIIPGGENENGRGLERQRSGRNAIQREREEEGKRVVIQHVAAGGYVDHSFVAMALSNGIFLFSFFFLFHFFHYNINNQIIIK